MGIIVFIESGVLFPFLPGDSLLVTAAIVHASLGLELWQVVAVCIVAAIAGDQAGYWLGARFGRRLFKDDARVLRTDRLEDAEAFFERHGHVALVLGRYVPIVRTYVPFAAGTARMRYSTFIRWNVLGSLVWVGSMTSVGVLLSGIPGIAHSIEGVMLVVIAVSMLPMVVPAIKRWWVSRRSRSRADAALAQWAQEARSGMGRQEAADGEMPARQERADAELEVVGAGR